MAVPHASLAGPVNCRTGPAIESVRAQAYRIPTDAPEGDGTFSWDATTLVLVEVHAAGRTGLGYSYTDACVTRLIEQLLAGAIHSLPVMDSARAWQAMQRSVRNLGREGLCATAISAVDVALWDLKARLLDLPLALLLGRCRDQVPIYGSGGFTTYTDTRLREQLADWVENDGCAWVKMKIGSDAGRDPHRVAVARDAIGRASLFVDANGAYTRQQALQLSQVFTAQEVCWFEEPVSSDDLDGLAALRARVPPGMDVAAGEYGYTVDYFRRMLDAHAVHVQQADLTRCGGVTGFLQVAALCAAHHIPLSGHCAPALHLHAACAVPHLRHLEWFHDHVRIERMLFEGAPVPDRGVIRPDLSRSGLGLVFKHQDAERFRLH